MAVQGALWLAKRLSLNLIFSFLIRISLLLLSSSDPIGLTRLGRLRSRPYWPSSRKFLGYSRESNPGPLGEFIIIIINIDINIQSVLRKGRSFTANSGTKAVVLPKGRSSTANLGTKVVVLLGMNRCSRFPLLSAPYSLFSI